MFAKNSNPIRGYVFTHSRQYFTNKKETPFYFVFCFKENLILRKSALIAH